MCYVETRWMCLPEDIRPLQCIMLEPDCNGKCYCYGHNKWHAVQTWYPYQVELLNILEKFGYK